MSFEQDNKSNNNNRLNNGFIDPNEDLNDLLFNDNNIGPKGSNFQSHEHGFNFDSQQKFMQKALEEMAVAKAERPSRTDAYKRNNKVNSKIKSNSSSRSKKWVGLIFVVFLLFLGGIVLGYKYYNSQNEKQKLVKTDWGEAKFDVPQSSEMINVLAIGFDKGGYRTDTMMVINFNPKTSNVNLISIPRDTLVGYKNNRMKLNSLFAVGKFELTLDAIKQLTGMPIHYYVAVDTEGFKNIVDALGGVDFNVPRDMRYPDPYQNLNINLKKGMQHLDGDKAEQLVRYRKYVMGDLERENVQKDFIKALIQQKLTLANVSDMSKLEAIYNNLKKYVRTNLGFKDAMKYSVSALKIKSENFKTYTLPCVPQMINGVSYVIYDKEASMKLFNQITGQNVESNTYALNEKLQVYDIKEISQKYQNANTGTNTNTTAGTKNTGKSTQNNSNSTTNNTNSSTGTKNNSSIEIKDGEDIQYSDVGEVKEIENNQNNNSQKETDQSSIEYDPYTDNDNSSEDSDFEHAQ